MSNKEAIAQAFLGLGEGNAGPLVELLAENVTWTLIGSTAWSGTLNGRDEVLSKLAAPLAAALANPPTLVVKRMIAEGDFVVVESQGRNRTHSGKDYNNTYCMIFRLAGGAIEEVTEYLDTALVDAILDPPQR